MELVDKRHASESPIHRLTNEDKLARHGHDSQQHYSVRPLTQKAVVEVKVNHTGQERQRHVRYG